MPIFVTIGPREVCQKSGELKVEEGDEGDEGEGEEGGEEPTEQAHFSDFQKIITFFLDGILTSGKNLRVDLG